MCDQQWKQEVCRPGAAVDALGHTHRLPHELVTSLTIICGQTQLLQRQLGRMDGVSKPDCERLVAGLPIILTAARELDATIGAVCTMQEEREASWPPRERRCPATARQRRRRQGVEECLTADPVERSKMPPAMAMGNASTASAIRGRPVGQCWRFVLRTAVLRRIVRFLQLRSGWKRKSVLREPGLRLRDMQRVPLHLGRREPARAKSPCEARRRSVAFLEARGRPAS